MEPTEANVEVVPTPDWPWPGEYISIDRHGNASQLREDPKRICHQPGDVLLRILDPRKKRSQRVAIDWDEVFGQLISYGLISSLEYSEDIKRVITRHASIVTEVEA